MHVTHPVFIESSISSLQAGRFHIFTYNPYFQLGKSIIQNYAIYRIKRKVLMTTFIAEKKTKLKTNFMNLYVITFYFYNRKIIYVQVSRTSMSDWDLLFLGISFFKFNSITY